MPVKMAELFAALGTAPVTSLAALRWGDLAPGTALPEVEGLFPRRDPPPVPEPVAESPAARPAKAEKAANTAPKGAPAVTEPAESTQAPITFDDFMKVELVAVTVLSAERVEGSDKLLRLMVDLGPEQRQVVSGIATRPRASSAPR
jgi:methionyl-tRNA synthetase